MKRRVIAALLTAAVAVETIGMPLCAMASEVVPEPSSVVEDTTESTAEEDAETIEKAMQSSVVDETVSSVISDVDADVTEGGSEVLSGGENTADTAKETEKEPDKADTPLLRLEARHRLYGRSLFDNRGRLFCLRLPAGGQRVTLRRGVRGSPGVYVLPR